MVLLPPATSKDFNSYALYGRMGAEYGASPYSHVPRDFAGDAWYERTSFYWSDSPSVYGPLFTGLSTDVAEVAGESVTKARAGFGAITLLAFMAAVVLAARRIGSAKAAALIGFNPLILTLGVNDLHCDVLVGLFVLACVLALDRRRFLIAGVAIALAVSVKVTALPVIAGAVIWLWFRRQFRESAVFVASAAVVIAAGFVLAGGLDAIAPITEAAGRQTRFSIWNPVADGLAHLFGTAPPTLGTADKVVGPLATLSVAGVGLWWIWRHRNDATPVLAAVAGLVAYQVLGAYVLSWYAIWSLPALALVPRSRLAAVAMLHGAWVAIAYFNGWIALGVAVVGVAGWLVHRRRNEGRGPNLAVHGVN